MAHDLLPFFPLTAVLLPHNDLPLPISEHRYKETIGNAAPGNGHSRLPVPLDD